MKYYFLSDALEFPDLEHADSDGLLAIGGDLKPERILLAYTSGIFPWYNEDQPILWWSPNPRFVLFPEKIKVSKSMRQVLRKGIFKVTFDTDFEGVITACQQVKREGQQGTWITQEMLQAYLRLHHLGWAHSVEVWHQGELCGGLYGLSIGKCFFGESMFSRQSNASKAGFVTLVNELQKADFQLIDCQVHTEHLESLGAELIPRKQFLQHLASSVNTTTPTDFRLFKTNFFNGNSLGK
ncbi:MAG TPA: leucyl/phenylalanyl-tRNA--protein transferase [Microscillaceae bacterium]|jgi:leucyl/phenylalanyl-tRNA--protein transferase|nr:leucyl/phenylalanyl-tRNA--protein transferase [Microscillaceae bacterium]